MAPRACSRTQTRRAAQWGHVQGLEASPRHDRDPAQAEELRAQYEARLWKRHSYGEEAVRTFEEAALSYMNGGGEEAFLPPLIRRFKGRVLGSIKPGEIQQAARDLYPGRKPATWNRQVIVPARAVMPAAPAPAPSPAD